MRWLPPVSFVFALALSACPSYTPPEDVRLQGYLFNTPAPPEDDPELASLTVVVPSANAYGDDGTVLAEGENPFSDFPSWWRFDELPPSRSVHVVFDPPVLDPEDDEPAVEYVRTVLSGRTAVEDLFVDPGTFHLWPRADAAGWVGDWRAVTGTPGIGPFFDPETDGEGGIAYGTVTGAEDFVGYRIVFVDPAGELPDRGALYTDEDGAPAGSEGGLSAEGTFVVLGLAPGPWDVVVQRPDGSNLDGTFRTRADEDGVTSLVGFAIVD